MTAPSWAVGANEAVRTIPGGEIIPTPPFSWQQVQATATFLLETFIGRIAIAFGGIDIFGWKPLEFLADWGEARVLKAQQNYLDALNAQKTATFANAQVTLLTGGALATDVVGGVSLNGQFNEASANTLTGFTRTLSDGAGGGNFGPNGAGYAVWKKSGGLLRRHVDINDTALATDYQTVYVVMATPPEGPYIGNDAYTYLIARSDAAGTTFIWARIGNNDLTVGKTTAGSWSSPLVTPVSITTNRGDQWSFLVGTSTDDRQLIVKQNGVVRLTHTDTTSSPFGASYLHTGLASLAGDRAVFIIPFLDQTRPGELDIWAAADRQPTTI